MKIKLIIIIVIFVMIFSLSCERKASVDENEIIKPKTNIEYAGVRASTYGIQPFPEPEKWVEMINSMKGYFEGSKPVVVWIIGIVDDDVNCRLHFPNKSDKTYKNIVFDNEDLSERYLNYFDKNNINVFLQVEPANADVDVLIDIVLKRYGKHSSVIGYGVDIEWYKENDYKKCGKKLDDKTAEEWEKRVKSYNSEYVLFVKHWDIEWLPPNYRGELIFVDDSQMFGTFNDMKKEFVQWADKLYPNKVWFQIGYPADEKWWKEFNNPPQYMGKAISSKIRQKIGILWVDFTLKKIF